MQERTTLVSRNYNVKEIEQQYFYPCTYLTFSYTVDYFIGRTIFAPTRRKNNFRIHHTTQSNKNNFDIHTVVVVYRLSANVYSPCPGNETSLPDSQYDCSPAFPRQEDAIAGEEAVLDLLSLRATHWGLSLPPPVVQVLRPGLPA